MTSSPLPYSKQSINQQDMAAVMDVLESDWLTQGPAVQQFEKSLRAFTGARYCIAVVNGTAALFLACKALGLKKKDIGLTSSLSFSASANCIALCGSTPTFADIEEQSLNLSPLLVEKICKQQPNLKVVIPVDFAGVPADLPKLHDICAKQEIHLIEDAAHSIGSTYFYDGKEYQCGSCAHTTLAIFSFHPVKNITCGEGGAIMTNNEELAEKIRKLVGHGIEKNPDNFISDIPGTGWPYELQDLSFNFRISDLHAALGNSQLKRLPNFKAKKKQLVKQYRHLLNDLVDNETIALQNTSILSDPCYHLFPIRIQNGSRFVRQKLYEYLKEKKIFTQVHYWPIHLHPYYSKHYGFTMGKLPVTEKVGDSCLSLPLFPEMEKKDVERVAEALHHFFHL